MTTLNKQYLGTSIIEILIAVAVIAVAFISLMTLSTNTQKTTSYSRNLDQATKYNYQAADWARNMRTTIGWESFATKVLSDGTPSVTYCIPTLPTDQTAFSALSAGGCNSTDFINGTTIYLRWITFSTTNINNKSLTATITTKWQTNPIQQSELNIELARTQ